MTCPCELYVVLSPDADLKWRVSKIHANIIKYRCFIKCLTERDSDPWQKTLGKMKKENQDSESREKKETKERVEQKI